MHQHAVDEIGAQALQAARDAHAGMLGGEEIFRVAVVKFLAGLGDMKELFATRAHELAEPLFRGAVGGSRVENIDAAGMREIEQTLDIPIGGKRKAAAAGIFDLLVASELDRAKAKRAHAFP